MGFDLDNFPPKAEIVLTYGSFLSKLVKITEILISIPTTYVYFNMMIIFFYLTR